MKKLIVVACALVAAAALMSCGGAKAPKASDGGKVLNIYVWNDEFPARFNDYYASKNPAALQGVKVNFVTNANQDNVYQNKLDEVLLKQETAAADDKIDIFLVEADYALKYVDTDYTLDVIKDIGLTQDDVKNQYQYTKDVMTDSKGVLKGVSWQACPGGLVYRRSYAKEVLGVSEPEDVQKYLSDWAKFDDVAAKMKAKGYFMLSGYDDAYRAFSDNVTSAWVKENKIVIDPQIQKWIDQTKTYTDKGYNNRASLWSAESTQGMTKDGKVFCYFGPAWFIDFCMDTSASGDWAFCEGPQGFSWGGTWICAAAGTDNKELVKDIMYTLTCDTETMVALAKGAGDFANNAPAMAEVAKSDYQNAFLGGQNHMALFSKNAASIKKPYMSMYDQGMTEKLMAAMKDYFEGVVSQEEAWDNFYTSITETYPNLQR